MGPRGESGPPGSMGPPGPQGPNGLSLPGEPVSVPRLYTPYIFICTYIYMKRGQLKHHTGV